MGAGRGWKLALALVGLSAGLVLLLQAIGKPAETRTSTTEVALAPVPAPSTKAAPPASPPPAPLARPSEEESPVMPVMAALGAGTHDPVEHRAIILRALEDTGPTDEPWAAEGRDALAAALISAAQARLPTGAPAPVPLSSRTDCYRGGCVVRLEYAPEQPAPDGTVVMDSPAFTSWQAGKILTPPTIDPDSKRLRQESILLRPETRVASQEGGQ